MRNKEVQHEDTNPIAGIQRDTLQSVERFWDGVGGVGEFTTTNIRGFLSSGARSVRALFKRH